MKGRGDWLDKIFLCNESLFVVQQVIAQTDRKEERERVRERERERE